MGMVKKAAVAVGLVLAMGIFTACGSKGKGVDFKSIYHEPTGQTFSLGESRESVEGKIEAASLEDENAAYILGTALSIHYDKNDEVNSFHLSGLLPKEVLGGFSIMNYEFGTSEEEVAKHFTYKVDLSYDFTYYRIYFDEKGKVTTEADRTYITIISFLEGEFVELTLLM